MFFNKLHKSLAFHLLYIIPTNMFYIYLLVEIYKTDTCRQKEKLKSKCLIYNAAPFMLGHTSN